MPNEFQIYTFEFEGTTETHLPNSNEKTRASSANDVDADTGSSSNVKPAVKPNEHSDIVKPVVNLNLHADEIALEMERRIGRILRTSGTVQAEVRFYEGSLIIEGTILIMNWLGPIALAAGKQAFEKEFSRVVQLVVQRVLQKSMREYAPGLEPPREINVTPVSEPATEPVAPLPPPPTPVPTPARGLQTLGLNSVPTLTIVNTVLLLILLVAEALFRLPSVKP